MRKKTAAHDSKKTRGRKTLRAQGHQSAGKRTAKTGMTGGNAKSSRQKNNKQTKASADPRRAARGERSKSASNANRQKASRVSAASKNQGTQKKPPARTGRWTRAAREMSMKRFLIMIAVAVVVLVIYVTPRLLYLEVIDTSDLYAAQVDQAIVESPIQAERGNIYDRNMNLLAQSASAQNLKVIPYNVKDAQKLAKTLSSKLSLDYNTVYAKVTTIEDNIVEVVGSVKEDDYKALEKTVKKGIKYDKGMLYVIPKDIKDPKTTASAICAAIDKTEYDDVYAKCTQKKGSPISIMGQVDNDLAKSILNSQTTTDEDGNIESTNGVVLEESHKRYYTNGNFASYVLGFTNDNNDGVTGVESTYNSWLGGEDGTAYYIKDANQKDIPSLTRTAKEPVKGKDLVLTIDSNIQMITENALDETIKKWHAKSGTAIVMDAKNGEILAMATAPDFNLNNPYSVPAEFIETHKEDLKGKNDDEKQNEMWKNPAVQFVYEPGSTFKAITSAATLEEGVVRPDTHVVCHGSMVVDDIPVACTDVHGDTTVAAAIEHSCNPGLIQMIQKLPYDVFYRYAYDFGFGHGTGIELGGEEAGLFNLPLNADGSFNMFDYSQRSFGQGMATTPIQLLTGLNAVVNNGNYVTPTLISDKNKDIESNRVTKPAKKIISDETSAEMRNIMQRVVTGNPLLAPDAEGYSIGGKTGTAEKFINGRYSATKYVTSFFGYAPVEDPKYTIVVVIDEADPSAFGSTSAAPPAIDILKQTLDYKSTAEKNATAFESGAVTVPDLVGQNVAFAKQILDEKKIPYRIEGAQSNAKVLSQSIPANTVYDKKSEMVLTAASDDVQNSGKVAVPDLTGKNIQEANELLKGLGLNLKVTGSGFAKSQKPAAGTEVEAGSEVSVTFAN